MYFLNFRCTSSCYAHFLLLSQVFVHFLVLYQLMAHFCITSRTFTQLCVLLRNLELMTFTQFCTLLNYFNTFSGTHPTSLSKFVLRSWKKQNIQKFPCPFTFFKNFNFCRNSSSDDFQKFQFENSIQNTFKCFSVNV